MVNNKGKAVVFLIILIVISLGLGAYAYYMFQQKSQAFQKLTEDYDDLSSKYKAREMELDEVKTQKASLDAKLIETQSRLSEAQKKITGLTTDIEKEKSTKKQSQDEIAKLKASLDEEKKLKAAMEKDLNESMESLKSMDQRVQEMEAKLKELESKKKALEEKVKDLEQKVQNVELGTIVVSPEGGAGVSAGVAPPAKTEGKIAVVNKEYSFVVINLGSRDGVSVGSVFTVVHNEKPVGEIKVEKVHESMSAAGFLTPDLRDKVAEGDKVAFKR